MPDSGRLTLGPVLFNWPAEIWRDFYFRIADEAPVDTVCVGEIVCFKRTPFMAPHLAEVVERLQAAGKEVVLGTLALAIGERETRYNRDLALGSDLLVEANDVSVVGLLGGRPHAIGPLVNVYNEATLAFFARRGAVRVTLPVELPLASIRAIAADAPAEIEVFAFGRMPLAISARCYHARSKGLHKDNCQFVCGLDANGMDVATVDGESFLAVNGVQTLSHGYADLLADLDALRAAGVTRYRLSPHATDMVAVARIFRAVLDGNCAATEGQARLRALLPAASFVNGYLHAQPGAYRVSDRPAVAE